MVYSDGCCFGNGRMGSRAGYGVYWEDNQSWLGILQIFFYIECFFRNVSERLKGDQTNQRAELSVSKEIYFFLLFRFLF